MGKKKATSMPTEVGNKLIEKFGLEGVIILGLQEDGVQTLALGNMSVSTMITALRSIEQVRASFKKRIKKAIKEEDIDLD